MKFDVFHPHYCNKVVADSQSRDLLRFVVDLVSWLLRTRGREVLPGLAACHLHLLVLVHSHGGLLPSKKCMVLISSI